MRPHSSAPINSCVCVSRVPAAIPDRKDQVCPSTQRTVTSVMPADGMLPVACSTHPYASQLFNIHTHLCPCVAAVLSCSQTCQHTACGVMPHRRSTPIQLPYCTLSASATETANHTLSPHNEKAELSPQRCTGRPGRLLMTRSPRLTTSMPVVSCTHPTMLVATPAKYTQWRSVQRYTAHQR